MAYQSTVVGVLIASPSDVQDERDAISEVITSWNATHSKATGITFLPMRWETHATPELGDRPQGIINKQLVDQADVLIGVFWTRLGTPTGVAESGSAEEIDRFCRSGKRALLYFSSAAVDPTTLDRKEYERLEQYRKGIEKEGLLDRYRNIAELREKVFRHLSDVARAFSRPQAGGVPDAELTGEHVELLRILAGSREQLDAEDLAQGMKIPEQRARFLLDRLREGEFVGASMAVGRPSRYYLAKNGRALLAQRGLL